MSVPGIGVALGGAFNSGVGSHCEQDRWTGAHAKCIGGWQRGARSAQVR